MDCFIDSCFATVPWKNLWNWSQLPRRVNKTELYHPLFFFFSCQLQQCSALQKEEGLTWRQRGTCGVSGHPKIQGQYCESEQTSRGSVVGNGVRKVSVVLGTNCSPKGYYPVGAAALRAVTEVQQQHRVGSHAFCWLEDPCSPFPRGAGFLAWCTRMHCQGRDAHLALQTVRPLGPRHLLYWGKFFLNSAGPYKNQPNKYWSDQLWPRGVVLHVLVSHVGKERSRQKGRREEGWRLTVLCRSLRDLETPIWLCGPSREGPTGLCVHRGLEASF